MNELPPPEFLLCTCPIPGVLTVETVEFSMR